MRRPAGSAPPPRRPFPSNRAACGIGIIATARCATPRSRSWRACVGIAPVSGGTGGGSLGPLEAGRCPHHSFSEAEGAGISANTRSHPNLECECQAPSNHIRPQQRFTKFAHQQPPNLRASDSAQPWIASIVAQVFGLLLFGILPTARRGSSRRHLASVLQEGRKSANIHASSGVIWGIPINNSGKVKGGLDGYQSIDRSRVRSGHSGGERTPSSPYVFDCGHRCGGRSCQCRSA
jgi:hypothetical protein